MRKRRGKEGETRGKLNCIHRGYSPWIEDFACEMYENGTFYLSIGYLQNTKLNEKSNLGPCECEKGGDFRMRFSWALRRLSQHLNT